MNLQIPHKFKPLFKGELAHHRIISYYGGRGGGKTETLSTYAILKCLELENICFYVARQFNSSNANSLISIFKRKIKELNLNNYVTINNKERITFINGSSIVFLGISKNTIDNIRSIDNARYFWFEECHKIEAEILQVLIPSIRASDSIIFLTFNPQKSDDFIYKEYVLKADDDYSKAIKVNYQDNPFFPSVLERDRLKDFQNLPRDLYLHIWQGEPSDYNDMKVIDISKFGYYENYAESYKQVILSIDSATSTRTGADFSVVSVLALTKEKNTHLIHLRRGNWDFYTLLENIKGAYLTTQNLIKQNPQLILVEAKANGLNVIQELQRTTNAQVKAITPTNDKLTRVVNDLLPYASKLFLPFDKTNPLNNWIDMFLKECKLFRADNKHAHDDMIDSISQGLNFLYNKAFDFDKIREALSL